MDELVEVDERVLVSKKRCEFAMKLAEHDGVLRP